MNKFPKSVPIVGRVRVCLEYVEKADIKGKVVADIGSSFGWLPKEMNRFKPKKIVGVEPNKDAVKFAQKQKIKNTVFLEGDAANTNISSGSVDIVTLFDVIEHVPKNTEDQVFAELSRILKPGGELLLSTPFDHAVTELLDPAWYFGHRHYSEQKLRDILKKAGLNMTEFSVRGDLWSLFYMIWFYVSKWILRRKKIGGFMSTMDDKAYSRSGFATIFLSAKKKA